VRLLRRLLLVLVTTLLVAALLVTVVWILPSVLTEHPRLRDAAARHRAITDTRANLMQLLIAIGVAAGVVITALTFRLTRRTHESQRVQEQHNYELSRNTMLTERYSKAVEQLGHDSIDVRIGAIYALERTARDSVDDHGPIMEVLTAFLREHSAAEGPQLGAASAPEPSTVKRLTVLPDDFRLRPDFQAAATVIGRRNVHHDHQGSVLQLERVKLQQVRLTGAVLTGAMLGWANFAGAELNEAHLEGANLMGADLRASLCERT
jgi:hypothetical protein